MKKNANKGFSLVELIIVIAIMAVLIGVLAPQFIKQVEKSRESTDLQNVEELKTAVETWVAEHGETATADVTIDIKKNTTTNKFEATVAGADSVTEYGVTTTTVLKSTKWAAIKWTYKITDATAANNYKWSSDNSASTTGATYFNWDGSAK